jgi:cleavage and polyadenylation specificity factor subunit 1
MGAVLQQRINDAWQPLAFFSKKMNPTEQKYSAYDRELLAVYEVVKHFRHMLEARHFIIFTDHKPITYAFQQKRDKCSPLQFNHLHFITQFTTDIQHISGQDNVANTLSRVESALNRACHSNTAHAVFPECLPNHCQGLRHTFSETCTTFEVRRCFFVRFIALPPS